jgi:hypothetical protein
MLDEDFRMCFYKVNQAVTMEISSADARHTLRLHTFGENSIG